MRVGEHVGVGDLGAVEFWIMDDEGGTEPIIKSRCQPFMLAPGYHVEMPGPYAQPKDRIPKRPGFPTDVTGLFGDGNVMRSLYPGPVVNLFGLGSTGGLGFFEVLSPAGGQIAAFRCQPYYVESDLAVKQVTGGTEVLRQRGAAEFPEGTMRSRHQALRTHRR